MRLFVRVYSCCGCYTVAGCWAGEEQEGCGRANQEEMESWKAVRVFDEYLGDIENINIGLVAQCWKASQNYINKKCPKNTGREVYINVV